ncbi:DUF6446 family protein [Pikeienuella sp. HZG-20]|uniref:DUF6446 family protein n=1 Tax=Paludibacillus litoralis TaxID=3133267 RepID=UPI0030EC4A5E
MTKGRLIIVALAVFAVIFGAVLWWYQTRGYYVEVTGVDTVRIAGVDVPVEEYLGLDAPTSPLKMRGCFKAPPFEAPPAPDAAPLVAPGWFSCFDAGVIEADLATGAAKAFLAEANTPYGFDRIVAAYPDGRAFQWRQINSCGAAFFAGRETPADCPIPESE